MKHFGTVVTLFIFVFWGIMNTLMVLRQHEMEKLTLYQKKVNHYLESSHRRERWLGIYKKLDGRNRKLGYSGTIVQKIPGDKGTEFHTEFDTKVHIDAFGKSAWIIKGLLGTGFLEMKGLLIQDSELKPMSLVIELFLPRGGHLLVQGSRMEDSFLITVHNDTLNVPPLEIPSDKLELGNGLFPALPLAGLEEGETFNVPTFDPVFRTHETATVNVVSLTTEDIDGVLVDVYTLETSFKGAKSTSLVTRDGTLLRMELGPPLEGVTLRRERPKHVKRGLTDD